MAALMLYNYKFVDRVSGGGTTFVHHAKVENVKVAGWRFLLERKLINKATVSKFILISSVAEPVKQKLLKGSRAEIICFKNTGIDWIGGCHDEYGTNSFLPPLRHTGIYYVTAA